MSLIGPIAAREAKYNEIDAAIEKFSEQIRTLKTQRNEFALISSLPAEILAKIFLFVRAEFAHASNMLQWIAISHVSTHWRNIAVNYVALWTRPPFGNNLWAAEMIKRSKLANISIHFNFMRNRNQLNQKVALLEQALARDGYIRELDILNVPLSQQNLVNALPTYLPHLERLHISHITINDHDGPLLLVPGSILSAAGKLRQLNISGCRMEWIPHLPPSITSLRLYDVGTISDSTFLQFINALDNLPELEKLELKNSFPGLGSQDCSRHISFQKLRRLRITSRIEEATIFFNHITFPPTARIFVNIHDSELELQMTPDFIGSTADLFASLAQSYYDCRSDLTFRSLSLDRGSWGSGIGITLSMPDDQNDKYSLPILSLTLHAARFTDPIAHTSILLEMFDSGLYLKDISFVSLMPSFSPQALAQTLGQLPNISRINASRTTAAKNLIEALLLPAASSSEALCFANLSTLELCKISFSDLPTTHQPHNLPLSTLGDCLIWRYTHGAKISRLSLEEYHGLDDNTVNFDNLLKEIELFGVTEI